MTTLATPTKPCASCGQTLPWHEFHAKARWDDGTMRQPHAYCKNCQRAYTVQWQKRKRASDPDWHRARARKAYARLRNDPERWAADLERRKMHKRRQRGSVHERLPASVDGRSPSVDAAPFAAWLSMKVAEYGSVQAVATACGMSESRVTKVKNGGVPRVELSSVDAALQAEGSTMLDELGY